MDVARPAAVAGAALVDVTALPARPDAAFDRFVRLVRNQLGVPVSLVSLVSREEQVFPGALGLPPEVQLARRTPLTHSVCQHVVLTRRTLLLEDIRVLPWLADNLASPDLGVVAYAGAPLVDADGTVVGSLCAIDHQPRAWTATDREVLEDLAAACSSEIALRQLRSRADAAVPLAPGPVGGDVLGRLLLALSEGLAAANSIDDVVAAVSRLAHTELGTDHAGIAVRPPRAGHTTYRTADAFSTAATAHWEHVDLARDTPVSLSTRTGRALYYRDHEQMLLAHPALRDVPVVDGSGARAAVPLQLAAGTVGALFLGWPGARDFDPGTRALLTGLGRYTAQAVNRAQLLGQQGAVAATLQQALLTELPQPEHLELHARYVPAVDSDQVGGDWYDAVVMPDGATTLVIGDVVGHDLEAAAAMGQLRSMVRTLAWTHQGAPSHVLSKVDRAMDGLRSQTMATCLLARVEAPATGDPTRSRRFQWSNAGHPSALLVRPDGTAAFLTGPADLPLGILTDVDRRDHAVDLPAGSTLLLFTDGLVERRERSTTAGLDSLLSSCGRHGRRDLEDLVTAVLDELVHSDTRTRTGRHSDDVAVLAVRLA